MFDQLVGLLLLGLGINTSIYAPNSNVKGETTVATQEARMKAPPFTNTFRLNRENFEVIKEGTRAGTSKRVFNVHDYGLEVLSMQENFIRYMEASRAAKRVQFEAHKLELKQRLATIRDTKKKAVVERIQTNCQNINDKRTDKMKDTLSKLSSILTNVTNRAATDSAAINAIVNAQTAIADAQARVASQAAVLCVITISTETNLKTDVGKTISALQSQLQSVHAAVVAAKKAVKDAIKLL